jgi:hypothetical protein
MINPLWLSASAVLSSLGTSALTFYFLRKTWKQQEETTATAQKLFSSLSEVLVGLKSNVDVCDHCKKIVDKWFTDGYGRTTCAQCKPEGFAAALRDNRILPKVS